MTKIFETENDPPPTPQRFFSVNSSIFGNKRLPKSKLGKLINSDVFLMLVVTLNSLPGAKLCIEDRCNRKGTRSCYECDGPNHQCVEDSVSWTETPWISLKVNNNTGSWMASHIFSHQVGISMACPATHKYCIKELSGFLLTGLVFHLQFAQSICMCIIISISTIFALSSWLTNLSLNVLNVTARIGLIWYDPKHTSWLPSSEITVPHTHTDLNQPGVKNRFSGDATNRELVARYCGTEYDREVKVCIFSKTRLNHK